MKVKSDIKEFFINVYKYIIKYKEIILMFIPFIVLDLTTRIIFCNSFVNFTYFIPNLFTLLWTFFFIFIVLSFKTNIRKKIYIIFVLFSVFLFLLNNIYYSMTENFFDFSLVEMASEGSSYIIDTILKAKIWIYLVAGIVAGLGVFITKNMPKNDDNNNYKLLFLSVVFFTIVHSFLPILYGKENSELTWNTWKNKRNIYINFNDNNKCMEITGLYEYAFRNFYITFLKAKKTDNQIEIDFLKNVFEQDVVENSNQYTGIFKDKNIIFLQLEGIDDWLFNEDVMPNLHSMLSNSYSFNNHYSYYNGGGSTFNSEFAVNTGYITPLSYTQNAYTFNKNLFNYSMANLFKSEGYIVNAFHMNSKEFYSRGINYNNWGFDNYYGLKDMELYNNNEYMLDTELIKNETFYDLMFHSDKRFVDYIITYSVHMPFNESKGVCKMILDKRKKENEINGIVNEVVLEDGYVLSEEDCVKIQAHETDDMVGLLLQALKDNNLYDNTVIVAFTDHYLYTLNDATLLDKYKETSNNLINKTPFFIWSSNTKKKNINEVTSQLNILPTVLNLFGLEYHTNYYIGNDALDPNYKGIVLFSDFSWYDGNVYVDGGSVTNDKNIADTELQEKNAYIDYVIKKNDLILKYDYFKILLNNQTQQ